MVDGLEEREELEDVDGSRVDSAEWDWDLRCIGGWVLVFGDAGGGDAGGDDVGLHEC